MDAGGRVSFTFSGTSVRWIGYRDQWSGIARVRVDGGAPVSVDTYASTGMARQTLFTAAELPPGTHTVEIEVPGERSAASGGLWVWIDRFDVTP